MRYLDDGNQTIKTYFANLVEKEDELREGETPFDLQGEFLRDNIVQLVSSPDKSEIFWLTETLRDASGTISNPDGSNARAVFSSPFTEWLPQWYSSGAINMTTKASGYTAGYSYNTPIATGTLNRTVGDITGLTTLTSPNGSYVLYSEGGKSGVETYVFNTETGESDRLFLRTLSEKCAWADNTTAYCGVPEALESGVYPDVWYQGKTLFTDTIFEIDAGAGNARQIYSPIETDSEAIDIYKPFVSESGDYLIFNDKGNMSLWAFTLSNPDENPFRGNVIPNDAGL